MSYGQERIRYIIARLAALVSASDAKTEPQMSAIRQAVRGGFDLELIERELKILAQNSSLNDEHAVAALLSLLLAELPLADIDRARLNSLVIGDAKFSWTDFLTKLHGAIVTYKKKQLASDDSISANSTIEMCQTENEAEDSRFCNEFFAKLSQLELLKSQVKIIINQWNSSSPLQKKDFVHQLSGSIETIINNLLLKEEDLKFIVQEISKQLRFVKDFIFFEQDGLKKQEGSFQDFQANIDAEIQSLQSDLNIDDNHILRERVQSRLGKINSLLQQFKERERRRREIAEKRNEELEISIEELNKKIADLEKNITQKNELLERDFLTKVHSRYAFTNFYINNFPLWLKRPEKVIMSVWDIDYFKKINDKYGHDMGDAVLRQVGQTMNESIGEHDFIARLGGEEFALITQKHTLLNAEKMFNVLREKIAQLVFTHQGQVVQITISCGLTSLKSDDTPQSIYQRADQALYQAKNNGRNRVVSIS